MSNLGRVNNQEFTDLPANFIGQPLSALIETMGLPYGHVNSQGNCVLLFGYQGGYFACELSDGICVTAYNTVERCGTGGIKPLRPKTVFIRRHCGGRIGVLKGSILNVSATDMSISLIDDNPDFFENEKIYCCTNVRPRNQKQVHIGLYATMQSWIPDSKELRVTFDIPFETHSYRALKNYIMTRQVRELYPDNGLNTASVGSFVHEDGENLKIIKSDLCLTCPAGLCGFSYNIFNDTVNFEERIQA